MGIQTKPVLIGPLTFLKLSKVSTSGKTYFDYGEPIIDVYSQIFTKFRTLGVTYIQIDEPILVTDLESEDIAFFQALYERLLREKENLKIILQTYFGDVRDVYTQIMSLDFDAVGLDFVEGVGNIDLIEKFGFPSKKLLFAGVVNGRNVWINDYRHTLQELKRLQKHVHGDRIVLNTSCSLLHVPYTIEEEQRMKPEYRKYFAFAKEKLRELQVIARLMNMGDCLLDEDYLENVRILKERFERHECCDEDLRKRIRDLVEDDFLRKPPFETRIWEQKKELKLPVLPTTTVGSFPQTSEIRRLRRKFKDGEISFEDYDKRVRAKIAETIKLQEDIGLDVLVHGEFERNDMVEYFGEHLSGFLFTENGWVQSYGTRCVKPPIIFGDVRRPRPITVDYIAYAQSLTSKPVKGIVTGPVTILSWSFAREDLSPAEIAYQIALAIRDEVMDLEAKGIRIIQIDEPALREKLPLRRRDWYPEYLCWAIKAFRLVHSGVRPHTEIHTHMCYGDFRDMIEAIDDMDVDVITFEAARSEFDLLEVLTEQNFKREVGPGVYDVHSPRIPSKEEIKTIMLRMIKTLDVTKLWVNPDCGLKTRGVEETVVSLKNMVAAVRELRSIIV